MPTPTELHDLVLACAKFCGNDPRRTAQLVEHIASLPGFYDAALRPTVPVGDEPVGYATKSERGWVIDGILIGAGLKDGSPLYLRAALAAPDQREVEP